MIKIDEGGEIRLDNYGQKYLRSIKLVMDLNARALQRYIRQEKMTGGTTETRLRVRTGRLRASVSPIPAEIKDHTIQSGISIGTVYGRIHIGRRGQITTIRPVNTSYLTIPLPAVQTKAGISRGTARSFMGNEGAFGDTFIARSKAGNLIIFGKRRILKGARTGELRQKIIPLFLLVKQVRVKARIHLEDLYNWIRPRIIQDFIDIGTRIR